MINWPRSLIREIARRRVVFFLGAGVSASAQNEHGHRPKEWKAFLREATDLVPEESRTEIDNLIEESKFLLALQAISDEAEQSDYQTLLNRNFNNPSYIPSDLHRTIYNLDANIVITTNFDKIYETYCESTSSEGYKVVTYDALDLGDLLRSDTRLIIKAHGTINNIQNMVFTKSQYHAAKKKYPGFYEIIKAIFLTHTCIFIGCGLDDPDVLLLLEDVKITSSSTLPHYSLVLENSYSKFSIADWYKTYNIKALQYEPNHNALIEDLKVLFEQVEACRMGSCE
jgi:hypothetical protein